MECKVCLLKFNKEDKRPRYIPCGHTFCSCCLEELLKDSSLACHICKVEHTASDITQFPVALLIEELIGDSNVSKPEEAAVMTPDTTSLESSFYTGKTISKKLTSLREEQKEGLKSVEDACCSMARELMDYNNTLSQWDTEHRALLESITRLMIKPSEEAIQMIAEERSNLRELKKEGEEHKSRLGKAKEMLSTVETAQEVVTAIGNADQCQVVAEEWHQKCREKFPNIKSVHRSFKVRMLTEKALKIMYGGLHGDRCLPLHSLYKKIHDDGCIPVYLADEDYNIKTKVDYIAEFASMRFTAEHLRKPDMHLKGLLKANLVYATKFLDSQRLFAKVSLQEDGKILLHGLAEDSPPEGACILQYDDALKQMNETNTLTFLDIALSDSPARRVFIRLNPVSVRGRHYVILCTGQLGRSYTGSILRKVVNQGSPGEFIVGGRFSGAGGPPFLPFDKRVDRTASPGLVFGLPEDVTKGSEGFGLFCVCTKGKAHSEFPTAYGRVESGLDVFISATKMEEVTSVKLVDCGVALG